MKCAHV